MIRDRFNLRYPRMKAGYNSASFHPAYWINSSHRPLSVDLVT